MNTKLRNIILLLVVAFLVFSVSALSDTISQTLLGGKEQHSPSNWIEEDQIKVYKDYVVLDVQNAIYAGFTNTNSMDPFIDEQANAIEITPSDPNSITIGDVISYQAEDSVVIHRVIEKGQDQQGMYYIVKGDNNTIADPGKVRFEDVKGVVVAVIY